MTTRITTPFDATSTAADVVAGTDLSGRNALITGGGSGIGLETAAPSADQASVAALADNHLGHFALTLGLYDALATAGDARIVSVSSSGHGNSPVVFDDLFFDRRPYDAGAAYAQSRTANVLFAVEASRRWAEDGITANALMPGASGPTSSSAGTPRSSPGSPTGCTECAPTPSTRTPPSSSGTCPCR